MNFFHPFILPFLIGAYFLFAVILVKFVKWIWNIESEQKTRIVKSIFSLKTIYALWETFREALIHRNIYKRNPMLGYMHMSLAFGWFLLIVMGKVQSSLYFGQMDTRPWLGIFFNYFVPYPHDYFMAGQVSFLMDFFLLITLSGVFLAFFKRFRSKKLGMKKTTNHNLLDRITLTSLWGIFPSRLLAESVTSALTGNGDFLTGSLGNVFAYLPAIEYIELPLWWIYSICLGAFFICLPFSRYMHIATEVLLIFLRKWGVVLNDKKSGYTDIQLNACSRCGICIDVCQLNTSANINNVQSVYFVRDARYHHLTEKVANNCLMCGRCVEACPVGLDLTLMRRQFREKQEQADKPYYNYAQPAKSPQQVDVVYFAGCMSHLTPSIILSMKKIFGKAGVNYWFMDEDKGLCCGRPLRQQGFTEQAKQLVEKNKALIASSGAKMLVTSCPICYKSFKDEYMLDIQVLHHSEFIENLLKTNKLTLNKSDLELVFHDPCELGRGSGVYDQPRYVLQNVGNLKVMKSERENSLCCGASLANTAIGMDLQDKIRDEALAELTVANPDVLVTACPLCKKTFDHAHKTKVLDIAEIVAENIN
jgi:Fe-S oxidoreductase